MLRKMLRNTKLVARYTQTKRQAIRIANKIVAGLNISGPFNIQLMAKDNELKVIECNLRSSRTFPFISKTFDFNFIRAATKIMLGIPVKRHPINENELDFVACKAPMFSFSRLAGADPHLGVEMSSTGEVACFGRDVSEAFLLALFGSGFKFDKTNKKALLSCGKDRLSSLTRHVRFLSSDTRSTPHPVRPRSSRRDTCQGHGTLETKLW